MEKSHKKIICVYTLLFFTFTVLALLFRMLARVYAYDADIGYFKSGALFPILHFCALFLIALLALSALFLFRRSTIPEELLSKMKQTCVIEKSAAIFGGLLMTVVSLSTLLFYWVSEKITPSAFTVIGLLSAFLSIFFFLFFWIPSAIGKATHIVSGLLLVLHFVYILVSSYFELYTPMNNPVKVLLQVTAIAAILYLLSDLRFYLGSPRPSAYVAFATAFLGFAFVSTASIGMFEVQFEAYTALYRLYNLACLALLIPAAVRLVRFFLLLIEHERENSNEESDEETSPEEAAAKSITEENEDKAE